MIRLTCSILAVSLTCAACATTPPPAAPATTVCLPLKAYTPQAEAQLAAEIKALADGDPLVQAIADYGAMRAADRACMGAKP